MYTQCPDCSTAFRVTAEVLRQAAGKVRCGGCGNAFDALSYLSEALPQQPQEADGDLALPELTPESVDSNETLPRNISAEQSAALLKTLDQLAGSNIRIEDTGVEWRVLDEADSEDAPAEMTPIDVTSIEEEIAEHEEPVDELLEESPTPVDEFLTQTPEIVEAAEIFEEVAASPVDELRFDDNTPLPDDFDFDDAPSHVVTAETEPDIETQDAVVEEARHDITLSEPEEWQDILGEFEGLADELRSEDAAVDAAENRDETDSGILDVDTQFALQAEALGIEITGIHDSDDAAPIESASEAEAEAEADDLVDEPIDALQLADDDEDSIASVAEEDPDNSLDEQGDLDDLGDLGDLDEPAKLSQELAPDTGAEMTIADELAALEALGDADAAHSETETIETPAETEVEVEVEVERDNDVESAHFVAPLTEEEQTVNMQIDQDLMALAIEDKDGFASTIVIPPEGAEDSAEEAAKPAQNIALNETSDGFESIIMEGESVQSALDIDALGVDAAASSEIKKMIDAKELESLPQSPKQRNRIIAGVVTLSVLIVLQVLHQSREALATHPAINSAIGPIYRALGSPIRPKWDVTGWRFEATTDISQNDIVEQDAPEGDATATTDDAAVDTSPSVDEPPRLTVYSIIGNKSDAPLPYPMIAISLTDRYDATIGNTLLAPLDYLPAEQDANELVAAGNSFNAMINIEPLPEAATGFKLDVCYRLDDQQLRCAIEDFK